MKWLHQSHAITLFTLFIVVFSPITTFSIRIGMIPLYLVEILVLGLLGWVLAHSQLGTFISNKKFPLTRILQHITTTQQKNTPALSSHNKRVLLGQTLVVFGLILGLIFAEATPHGWGILKSWFLFPIILYWLSKYFIKTRQQRHAVIIGWICGITLLACFALGSWVVGDLTYDGRLRSFFPSPNTLAMYLFPAPLLIWYAWRQRLLSPYVIIPAGIMCLSALALTYSYTVWISLLVSSLLWIYRDRSSLSRTHIKQIFFVILTLLLLVAVTQYDNPKITHWFETPERSSLASRLMIWQSAGKMLADHPFFGIGAGNFQATYLEYQRYFPPYLEWAVPEPHNLLLALWLETGLIGLIGFTLLITATLKRLWTQLSQQSRPASHISPTLSNLVLALLTAFLIQGFFDTPYFSLSLAYLFWTIIALV